MEPTTKDVEEHFAGITPAKRQADARTLAALLTEITGASPVLWSGNIVGFGECRYRYPTGREGLSPILGFAARKPSITVYLLDGVEQHTESLAGLGPHETGKGCLYLKDVGAADQSALRRLLAESARRVLSNEIPGVQFDITD